MKATLERTDILRALTHVHRIPERRNTVPILSNVLLRAEENELGMKTTDLDLEVTESVGAMVERPGVITVNAVMLYEIVRKLPEGSQIALDMEEESTDNPMLNIQAGRTRFALQTLPDNDFPSLDADEFANSFELGTDELRSLVDRTQFAISTEETRYYLNGIYLHAVEDGDEKRLRAVATDGHRLAQAELPAPEGSSGMPGIIVPRKTVMEVQKLLDQPKENVSVELSETKIRFKTGSIVLTSNLIDGTFPDYKRVIPQQNDKELRVDREPFSKAVDRVSIISSDRGRAIKMTLKDGRMVLSVNNPDTGTATEELDVDYEYAEIEIGFNSRYLLDIVTQLETDTTLFKLADSSAPSLIMDDKSQEALYVLMPMRV